MTSSNVLSRDSFVVIVHPVGTRDVMLQRAFVQEHDARAFAARHAKPDRWVELDFPPQSDRTV